jgi:hypothetical protein
MSKCQTVLIAAPLPNGGHVRVIPKVADPVHFGGPFSTDALIAVVRSRESPGTGAFALTRELFLAVDGQTIDRVIEQTPQAARLRV